MQSPQGRVLPAVLMSPLTSMEMEVEPCTTSTASKVEPGRKGMPLTVSATSTLVGSVASALFGAGGARSDADECQYLKHTWPASSPQQCL